MNGQVWVGGCGRSHMEITGEGELYRPMVALWVEASSGFVLAVDVIHRDARDSGLAGALRTAMAEYGQPSTIRVADALLADEVRGVARGSKVLVAPTPEVGVVLAAMARDMRGDDSDAYLEDGASPAAVARLFAAAARLSALSPWERMSDEPIVTVDIPALGWHRAPVSIIGALRESFGLVCFATAADYERFADSDRDTRLLSLELVHIDELSTPRRAEIERHGWMIARELAPVALNLGPQRTILPLNDSDYEIAAELCDTVVDALLEADLFADRKTSMPKSRSASSIAVTVDETLLEDELDIQDQAYELLDQAQSAPSDAQARRLLEKALRIDPNCSDALVELAWLAKSAKKKRELCVKAVDTARRALGEAAFEELVGGFWGVFETRPYMRAMYALATVEFERGDFDAALQFYNELLRLSPGDNLGARYDLVALHLARNEDASALAVIKRYARDPSPVFTFGKALALWRAGSKAKARALIVKASAANPHVAPFLKGEVAMPGELPDFYIVGSIEEAMMAARLLRPAFSMTHGVSELFVQAIKGRERARGR